LSLPDSDQWEQVINLLIAANWLQNQDDRFYLVVNLASVTVGELTELIHEHHQLEFAVLMQDSSWFESLDPVLADVQRQKRATLGLPVASVINNQASG